MTMKDKKFAFWSSLVILIPCVIGLFLWNKLPQQLPPHFGPTGQADGWSGRPMAVFGIPAIMLAVHWALMLLTRLDKRNIQGNEKVMKIVMAVIPALSLILSFTIYGSALGYEFRITKLMFVFMGLLFIGLGNYLPKCRQNATLGIKLPWTLYNEENWNRTHRFAGKVWMIGGIGMVCFAFLPIEHFGWLIVVLMLSLVILPTLYSWLLYKKQLRDGLWTQSEGSVQYSATTKQLSRLGMLSVLVVLGLVACVLFTGNIGYEFREDHLFIEASYWEDSTLYYEEIDSVELWEEGVSGTRELGFGSPRLLLGLFHNEEFGNYIRYTYAGSGPCVVITAGEETIVLSGETRSQTEELYQQLLARIQ